MSESDTSAAGSDPEPDPADQAAVPDENRSRDPNRTASAKPPTPDGLPLLGNGWAFARDPIAAMESWAEHGDLVRLRLPGDPMYMVTGPDLIERILASEAGKFSIGPEQREAFAGIEDHAVTVATGERWERLRSALAPVFSFESIQRYGDRVGARTAAVVEEYDNGEAIDLKGEMRLLSVNVLADALLGIDARGEEDVLLDAADAIVDRANFSRPGQLLPDWIPTPTERRFRRSVRRLDEYVEGILERRDGGSVDGDNRADVRSLLLAAHDRGDLTFEEVRDNLVALLLAGHESPSSALTSAWYLLSDHPEQLDRLVEEYDRVVDGDHPGMAAYSDLERTQNVVSETLRLYPPTAGINRQATEPVTLGGYDLPEGARFMIPQWVPHRDPRFWEDPGAFDPSRWDRETDRPNYAYFPFGGGPRNCIGNRFARVELTLALATMVGRLALDVETDGPLTFTSSLQLRATTEMTATVRHR